MSEIGGYEIYYFIEGSAENEGETITINDPSVTQYTTEPLNPGIYFFAITTIDDNGLYSETSEYVEILIN
jgi:hypothetical protein